MNGGGGCGRSGVDNYGLQYSIIRVCNYSFFDDDDDDFNRQLIIKSEQIEMSGGIKK